MLKYSGCSKADLVCLCVSCLIPIPLLLNKFMLFSASPRTFSAYCSSQRPPEGMCPPFLFHVPQFPLHFTSEKLLNTRQFFLLPSELPLLTFSFLIPALCPLRHSSDLTSHTSLGGFFLLLCPFNQEAGAQNKQHFGRSAWSNIHTLSGVSAKTAMSITHSAGSFLQ